MSVVGLWAFLFGNGNGVDGSGNGNTALFQNGAAQNTEGDVVFDGVDDYVEIPDDTQYAIAEGTLHLTFSADAGSMDGTRSTNVNDTSMQTLVSRDSSGNDGGGHVTIYVDGDGSIYLRHQSATDDYLIRTDPGLVVAGEDVNLVYSFSDTGGMTLYIDGIEVGSNTDSVANGDSLALSQNNEPWTLGASQSTSGDGVANNLQQFFDGSIGHFEIYDEPLAPSELNSLHDLSDGSDDGIITGTAGDDTIHGGNTVDESDGGAVSNDTISAGTGDDQVYAGDGADSVMLGEGADYASGGTGDDTIYVAVGNDSVDGGEGSDSIALFGEFGTNTIVGGEGGTDFDLVDLQSLATGVTVTYDGDESGTITNGPNSAEFSEIEHLRMTNQADSLDGSSGSSYMGVDGGAGDDTITTGSGDDVIIGGAGNDQIDGGSGADTIGGGAGDDTLTGGAGNDSLTGGDGNDVFVLSDGFGADTISDFDTGDSDGDGVFNDQFDVSNLTDSSGNPVNAWDVTVTDDGSGNALLTFSGGESVLLQGVSPTQFSTVQQMNAARIPFYAPGAMIDTPGGPRPAELLRAGDLVTTRDHGPQAIRWTRSSEHPLEDTAADARPVEIRAGALGRNLPTHDLIVSPQHRILVGGHGQLQDVFAAEAFAPAKSLTRIRGIRHMMGKTQITWIHFACDRHEVVFANGCLSESLLLGPMVLKGLPFAEIQALNSIFGPSPMPGAALNGPPARKLLTVGKARRQIAKHHEKDATAIAREIRKWDRDLAKEEHEVRRLRVAKLMTRSGRNASLVA